MRVIWSRAWRSQAAPCRSCRPSFQGEDLRVSSLEPHHKCQCLSLGVIFRQEHHPTLLWFQRPDLTNSLVVSRVMQTASTRVPGRGCKDREATPEASFQPITCSWSPSSSSCPDSCMGQTEGKWCPLVSVFSMLIWPEASLRLQIIFYEISFYYTKQLILYPFPWKSLFTELVVLYQLKVLQLHPRIWVL
jgi:hypothetical protein